MDVNVDGDLIVGFGDNGIVTAGLPNPQDPALLYGSVAVIPAPVLADATIDWDASAAEQIAKGLRNPWRLSVDSDDGAVYVGDVGDLEYEEVNRIPAPLPGRAPVNFGHPYYEGLNAQYADVPEGLDLAEPLLARPRSDGACGMVSGYVYRGDLLDEQRGRLLYGDLCSLQVRSLAADEKGRDDGGPTPDDGQIGELSETIVSIGRGPSGEPYGLGYQGGLYRLDPKVVVGPGP